MEIKSDEKPPGQITVGLGTRSISSVSSLARRPKSIWSLWTSDWDIYPFRISLHSRRMFVFSNLQGK